MTDRPRLLPDQLRSRRWFDSPANPGMTALYIERYLNFGLTQNEFQSGRPIIGIAQSGSDLSPCNRHHIRLAERIRDGIRDAGGIPLEFPVHPIQETGRRPTAALDRNLQTLGLIEILHGYPLDGVVLTAGCDKTTPGQLMAAASVNLPAIVLSGGPMLNSHDLGQCVGSGTVIWEARKRLASGDIDDAEFLRLACTTAPSEGHCNTMGTALTMNAMIEGLGMSLPGCAAIPAPYRERAQMAYATGHRIVGMVWEDLKPSVMLTRPAMENAIALCSALGGSSNAPWHLVAIARHAGLALTMNDWQIVGQHVPQVVNCQPVGEFLGEEFFRAGGVPSVMAELIDGGYCRVQAMTVTGKSVGETCSGRYSHDRRVIRPISTPVRQNAGFAVMSGNLFDSAVMKISAISDSFRATWLSNPDDPDAFVGTAVVFEGPEDYHQRINDPALAIDENSILVIRGCGPIGYPGSAEVVNMQPPDRLIQAGMTELPTIGDGRQSGTSASPSILNASPEAAAGGGLGRLRTGDPVRVDLRKRRVDALVDEEEWQARDILADVPASQTPWQALYRACVSPLGDGAVLEIEPDSGETFANIADKCARHSH